MRIGWLRRLLADLVTQVIGTLLFAAIVAVWTARQPSLKQWAGPVGVAVFIGTVALSFLLYNQFAIFRDRKKSERLLTPLEIEKRVRDWLYRRKFTVANDPQSYAHFQLVCTDYEGLKVTIMQLRDEPYLTIISKAIWEDNESGAVVRQMIEAPGSTFLEDLSIELAQLGVGYEVMGSPPREILIEQKVLFDESVTELEFLRHILLIRRGLDLVMSLMKRSAKRIGARLDWKDRPKQK
jgi:hypothetical protein